MDYWPIKVAIVAAGSPQIDTVEGYRKQAELFARILKNETVQRDNQIMPKFDVSIVKSAEEALRDHLNILGHGRILLFISNYFMEEAKAIAEQYRRLRIRVYVVSGLLPDDEVRLIPKGGHTGQLLSMLVGE